MKSSFFLFVTLLLLSRCQAAEFFVSPTGADTNPGTKARPFASFEAARDAVRELKSRDSFSRHGVTVWLRGGDYARTNAFDLGIADSGGSKTYVIWRACKGEAVRLLGGRRLTGFRRVKDPAVLARLHPGARAHVLELNLRAAGITDFGQLRSRGFGRATVPAHGELFFDGKPMTLARWPNEGAWEHIAGFPESSAQDDGHHSKIGKLENGFICKSDRPGGWREVNDLWVHGYWAYDWANSYEQVASLDREQGLVRTAPPHGQYGFRKGQRFYFLNVLEELDEAGEWCLDRKSGVLYLWPPGPFEPAETLFSISEQPLIRLTDVSNVIIRGVTFEAARANAIEMTGGANNRIVACRFRNLGNNGVVVAGGFGHGVTACDFENTGDGGVSLTGGDRQTLEPGGHFVENCHFQRQGRWSKCYVPAVHLQGVGLRASHNLIHEHPHCAILFWGNEHLIEFNEIHHVALETGDVGAIYTGRDWTFRGNRIRHNFIHHTGGVGMGSMGVYMDDCVSGTEVFGNIFYKVHWAMFIGGGRDHRVVNNLFVDCDPAIRMDGRGLDKQPTWHGMVYNTMKQRLYKVPQPLYLARYPEIAAVEPFYATTNGVPPGGHVFARNVCVGKWLEVVWHAKTNMVTIQDNYVGTNAGIISAEKMDFRIKRSSPVWQTGFKPIPVEKIGLVNDQLRRDLRTNTPQTPHTQ